jgi:hypothetical protein
MSHAILNGWSHDRHIAVATLERVDAVSGQLHHLREQMANQGRKTPKRWPKWVPLRVPRPFETEAPEPAAVKPMSIAEFRARIEEEGA